MKPTPTQFFQPIAKNANDDAASSTTSSPIASRSPSPYPKTPPPPSTQILETTEPEQESGLTRANACLDFS